MNDPVAKRADLMRVYVKDASLEVPGAPGVFAGQSNPQMNVQISSRHAKVEDDRYEVLLQITVNAVLEEDSTVFHVEVVQGGLFQVTGLNDEELTRVLGVICPNTLFPFAREAVADLIGKGGFPPVLLGPLSLEAVLAKQQQELAKAQAEATSQPKH